MRCRNTPALPSASGRHRRERRRLGRTPRASLGSTLTTTLALSAVLLLCRGARGDVHSCSAQHASGQREVLAGHLKVAFEQFAACSSDSACPEAIRAECAELLAGTAKAMPTVILSASDAKGQKLTGVKAFSADELVAERLDGTAISIDPGKHRFRFVLPSGEVLSTDELIREGEKNRLVTVETEPSEPPAAPGPLPVVHAPAVDPGPSQVAPVRPEKPEGGPRLTTGFWIASAVGTAGILSFSTFALIGRGIHSDLAECSPTCDPSLRDDYDALRRDYLLADVSLGVAALSLGAAAYFYFDANPLSGTSEKSLSANGSNLHVGVAPLPTRTGALLQLGNTF